MVFKDKIKDVLNDIPDFIDTKSLTHHHIWEMMTLINDVLLELVSLRIITKSKLKGIIKRFDEYIIYTFSLLNDVDKLELSVYYSSIIEWLLEQSILEEYYETSANVRDFIVEYYSIFNEE